MNLTQRLLLLLARVEVPEADRPLARWYAARADWDELVRMAFGGGVEGLVAAALEQLGWSGVPRAAAQRLVAGRLRTELDNRTLLEETLRLCALARQRGLRLVPFKGMALLMERPYRQLDLRTSVDIDLCASRTEFAGLERLILDEGYTPKPDRSYFLRHHQHLGFMTEKHRQTISVELHWTPFFLLFGSRAADEACLQRTASHDYRGQRLELLDPEDTLLGLLLHLANHRFHGQLKWRVDIVETCRHFGPRFSWTALWSRAAAVGAVAAARAALRACGVSAGDQPSGGEGRALLLRRHVRLEHLLDGSPAPRGAAGLMLDLLLRDRPRQAAAHLLFKLVEIAERGGLPMPHRLHRTGLGL